MSRPETTIAHARAWTADEMAATIRFCGVTVPVTPVAPPEAAVEHALQRSSKAVAAGSIYMIGPLRARLVEQGAVH